MVWCGIGRQKLSKQPTTTFLRNRGKENLAVHGSFPTSECGMSKTKKPTDQEGQGEEGQGQEEEEEVRNVKDQEAYRP